MAYNKRFMLLYPCKSYVRNNANLPSIAWLVGTSFGIISSIIVCHQLFTVRSGPSNSLGSVLSFQSLGSIGSVTNTGTSTPADLEYKLVNQVRSN